MSKIKVLHVASGDLWAGAESQVFQLLRAMNERRDIEVRATILNPGILSDRLQETGVQVCELNEQVLRLPSLARRLIGQARTWRPDIIHTHRRKEHLLGGLAARLSESRAVATIHGKYEIAHPFWRFRQSLLASLERLFLKRVHSRVIAVSGDLALHLQTLTRNVTVIDNAVDVGEIRRQATAHSYPLPERDVNRIIFLGRLVSVKRVDRIIRALSILVANEPGAWSFYVVGDGPLESELRDLVESEGLTESVNFVGFLPNPIPLLAQMDLLVFASEHEGLPMTALESLALGVPIVSPAIGGLTDLVRNAELGRIVRSIQPVDLADAIRKTALETRSLGEKRVSFLPERYTIERSADEYLSMYLKLLR